MIARGYSATLIGIDAYPVTIEVDFRPPGDPPFQMVGLPDQAVGESKVRVRSAIRNSGLNFPNNMIICNLAPGDVRKEGPALDLPIALTILACDGTVPLSELEGTLILGELGLDGTVRPVAGAVSVAIMARAEGYRRVILPMATAEEAVITTDVEVYGVTTLVEAVSLLNGHDVKPLVFDDRPQIRIPDFEFDYSDVKGQMMAIRALEIAAAGGHNLLMTGPPGSGKTMLARRLPTILPPLSIDESIEVTRIYSSVGRTDAKPGLMWERPFRAPHHSASHAALVGGGKNPKPGEVSLAHKGVLFLDEMPEFDRPVLESLRQPLEDGIVTVARVSSTMTFPAECLLVGAMNPCPCGYRGEPEEKCVSSPNTCLKYAAKISGPLLDRIDIHITVPRHKPNELLGMTSTGVTSADIRERVARARDLQTQRLGPGRVNGKMTPRELKQHITLDEESQDLMRRALARLNLSARAFDRLLKVARTLADLEGAPSVARQHLTEAIQYRESSPG